MNKSKVFTIETDKAVDYYNATPELLTELEARRDDPSFLTHIGAGDDEKLKQYNKLFFRLCEEDQSFCGLYASNPAAGEAELADRMLIEGQDEEC
jgi:hypothetical protein